MGMTQTLTEPSEGRSLSPVDQIARGLGWFSLGLGLAELIAPGRLARAAGLQGQERLVRAYGVREISSGMGALSINPAPAIWSRVAGDVVDLATLARGASRANGRQKRDVAIAAAAVVGVTLLDLLTATLLTKSTSRAKDARDYSDRSGFPSGAAQARTSASGEIDAADAHAQAAGADLRAV